MQPTSEEKAVKKLRCIQRSVDRHWVGNGFPVRTLLAYPNLGSALSPFLLLDYAGPMEFPPTDERLGVGEHPHRGFETVTIVYEGEVEHRDSSGGGGRIGPGDVQWMTAASGIVHEEFHGRDFARRGGMFEMVQLWVNLPAKDKMSPLRSLALLGARLCSFNRQVQRRTNPPVHPRPGRFEWIRAVLNRIVASRTCDVKKLINKGDHL